MRFLTTNELNDPEVTGGGQPSRWSSLRPGRSLWLFPLAVTLPFVAGACGGDDDGDDSGVPNPAAVFCEEQGGTYTTPDSECEFPDGSVRDAWEYFRDEGLED